MNRRLFLTTLIAAPVAAVTWKQKENKIAMVKRLMTEALESFRRQIDEQLFGIPYHQSDSSTGTWLGIQRSETSFWRK